MRVFQVMMTGLVAAALAGGAIDARADGQSCREFQSTVTVDGQPQQAHGTMCQQPDGHWEIVAPMASGSSAAPTPLTAAVPPPPPGVPPAPPPGVAVSPYAYPYYSYYSPYAYPYYPYPYAAYDPFYVGFFPAFFGPGVFIGFGGRFGFFADHHFGRFGFARGFAHGGFGRGGFAHAGFGRGGFGGHGGGGHGGGGHGGGGHGGGHR
jgi:hypothetical protein